MNIKLLQAAKRRLRTRGGVGGNGVVGKTVKASGKAVKATGEATKASTKAVGTGAKGAGKATKGVGKAVSVIPGVGTVVGGVVQGAGTGIEAAGSATEKAGNIAGDGIELLGNEMKNIGGMSSTDIAKKTAGLPVQAAIVSLKLLRKALSALVMLISTLSKMFSVIAVLVIIVLVILISTILSVVGVFQTTIVDNKISITPKSTTQSNSQDSNGKKDEVKYNEPDIKGWLAACKKCAETLHKDGAHYSRTERDQQTSYGKTRVDCTGYVWLCLVEYGTLPRKDSYSPWFSGNVWDDDIKKQLKGWEYIKPEDTVKGIREQLKKGDIVVHPQTGNESGHMAVFAGGHEWWEVESRESCKPSTKTDDYWLGNIAEDAKANPSSAIIRLKGSVASTIGGGDIARAKYPKSADGGVSIQVPILFQSQWGLAVKDSRFYDEDGTAYNSYTVSGGDIGDCGCGLCSLGMVVSYISGKLWSPIKIYKKFAGSGHLSAYFSGALVQNTWDGVSQAGILSWVKLFGIDDMVETKHDKYPTLESCKKYIDKGGVGIALMRPGTNSQWTGGGHYIVIRGYTKNGLYVNDPNGPGNYTKHKGHGVNTLNDHVNKAHSWAKEFEATSFWEGARPRFGILWFIPKK